MSINNTKQRKLFHWGQRKQCAISDISFIEFHCITYFCFANVNILLSILFLHQNFQEFYNLTVDPNQLTNIVGKLDPKFVTAQNEKLILLSMCKGPSCRQVFPPPKHGHKHADGAWTWQKKKISKNLWNIMKFGINRKECRNLWNNYFFTKRTILYCKNYVNVGYGSLKSMKLVYDNVSLHVYSGT